ncbi:CYTH domain-containing protein [Candidatus Saccharibacteria bacterium]|nr:CYTH domain-containing protein [Candidatus Saccharibacteria bacterium]
MTTSPESLPDHRETELRVFNIDTTLMRQKLNALGAVGMGTMNFKRAVLDVHPVNPNKWIRVRTEGDLTTLAIKERISADANGTGEVEVVVGDFDETLALLKSLNGYEPRSIQESRREAYEIDGAEVSIDSWPRINDFMEIEAKDNSADTIYRVAELLGVPVDSLTAQSVEDFYTETLGIDIKTTSIRFDLKR